MMLVDWRLSLLLLSTMARIQGNEDEQLREKRQALYPPPLVYPTGGTFKYRINYKIPSVPYTAIFAAAAGFKLVWQLPSGSEATRIRRSITDVHQAVELVYESQGFNGRSCLLKNICQAMEYVSERNGVIAKILKLLVGSYTSNSSSTEPFYCDVHVKNCPLEFIGIDDFIEQ